MISFRRSSAQELPHPDAEHRDPLHLISGYDLWVSNDSRQRTHLALIGDAEWTRYWFLDALAHTPDTGLPSFVITGPRDEPLRQMPLALNLPAELCSVRHTLPYSTDPTVFRHNMQQFGDLIDGKSLSLLLLGRDLTHVWPFLLSKKGLDHSKPVFCMADVTHNLKLPLSDTFRYFLVQDSHQSPFQRAVDRWYRHHQVRPSFIPSAALQREGTLYEVTDP